MAVGTGTAIALGVGTLGASALGAYGAHQQSQAAKDGADAQTEQIQAAREQAMELGGIGADTIHQYGNLAGQQLGQYGAQGLGEIMGGRDMAAGQMLGYGGLADAYMQQGLGAYQHGMGGAMQGLRQDMRPLMGLQGYADKAATVGDQFADQSRLGKLLDDPSGYLAQDPGYQYRLQQGEDAINRSASARGGRLSGRTLQELQQHGQGLASQELGAAAGRAQAADSATLQALGQQANIQAGLGRMGYGAQQSMAGQLGQMGLMGASGLADQYRGLAGLQNQMGSGLANLYQGAGSQLGQAYMGLGGNMANLLQGIGTGQANALAGASAQSSQLTQAGLPALSAHVPYAGGTAGAMGSAVGNLGQNLAMASMMGGGAGAGANPLATQAGGTGGNLGIPGVNLPG